jgi:predicted small integral membrane protein
VSEHTLQESARRRVLGLGTLPVACTVMVGINALYMLLVAFGNITDYGTNFDFVSHVLSMDTTNFGAPAGEGLDSDVMWRAIEADWVHHLAYVGVIIWESAAAIVLLCSLWAWLRASRTRSFDLARRLGTIGLAMILVLFMGGFIAIGGEWFQMWRSTSWNGLEPAFRNSVLAAFGIVLMHLPSPQWAAAADESAEGPLAR